jgi:6,7-dimethyl-8-ribityllumazine synthase
MAEKLKPTNVRGGLSAAGLRIGVVASQFNNFITDRLLAGALDALQQAGATEDQIEIARVPGSFELPIVAKKLAAGAQLDTGVPLIFCVLTCDTLEQAIDRAGLKSGNKGYEAGLAAVEMAQLVRKIAGKSGAASSGGSKSGSHRGRRR